MAFGLTMGTERATALQNAIQDELMKRQYSSEPGAYPAPSRSLVMAHPVYLTQDPVMAEYITIMVINNKTARASSFELLLITPSVLTKWSFPSSSNHIRARRP